MIDWQLSDFTVQYPPITTDNFQTLISAKKEFNDLISNVNEPLPKKGQPYNHQKFFIRYMSVPEYENVLLMNEAGTGKGLDLLFMAEHVLNQHNMLDTDQVPDMNLAHFKRTIILVKNKTLMIELKNQLVNVAAPDRYNLGRLRAEHINNPNIKGATLIKREMKKWYVFHTYETFAKLVKEYENDLSKLNIDYDHSLVIIDEAHNLFVEEEDKAITTKKDKVISKDSWNKEKTYYYLLLFLHQIKYSKKILSSATPMLNGVEEIGKILNLLLPASKQLPVADEKKDKQKVVDFYNNITVEELEVYTRGITTFVRAFNNGAVRVDVENLNVSCEKCPDDLHVFMCKMSVEQTKFYKKINTEKGDSGFGYYLSTVSNFVYPDGSIDEPEKIHKTDKKKVADIKKDAMKKVAGYKKDETSEVSDNEDTSDSDDSDDTSDDTSEESSEESSSESSEIMKKGKVIKKTIKKKKDETSSETSSSEEDTKKKKKGKNEKDKVAFEKYVIESKTPKNKREATQLIYKLNEDVKPKLVINTIEDVQKYSCKYAAFLKLVKNNVGSHFAYGKFNKSSGNIILSLCLEHVLGYTRYMEPDTVFIGEENKTLRSDFKKKPRYALLTGETIKNDAAYNSIKELMNSYENRHGEYIKCIIASRIARDGLSFNNILNIHLLGPEYNPSAMYQAISRGIRTNSHNDLLEETKDGKLNINVYRYAAIPDSSILNDTGVDVRLYEVAKEKEVDINNMMIKLKRSTVNCQINKTRNVRKEDKVKYTCIDPDYEEIDYTTYNAYYLEEDAKMKYLNILPTIGVLHIFSFAELYNAIEEDYTQELVSVMLEYIIMNKVPVYDRFGFISYLYKDGDIFYIDREYDVNVPSVEYAIYQKDLLAINNVSDVYVEELNVDAYGLFLQLDDGIEEAFQALSVDNKIRFLEEQFINKDKKYRFIIRKYDKLFFELKEVKITQKNVTAKGRGRPKKIQTSVVECGNTQYTDNKVFVNLLNLYKETNNSSFMQMYIKAGVTLRIYENKEVGWRNCSDCENSVYQGELSIIKNRFDDLNEKYDGLFGIKIGDAMRIVYNDPDKKTISKNGKGMARDKSRGKECSSYNNTELLTIADKLGIGKANKLPKEELCSAINKKLINDKRML